MKKLSVICALLLCAALVLSASAVVDGEVSRSTITLHDGVTQTHLVLSPESAYNRQVIDYILFDPADPDLFVDVTSISDDLSELATLRDIVDDFNATNGENKHAITAVNGDLWTVAYSQSRVEGSNVSSGGFSDDVVKEELTLPRGYNVYDGEIVCTPNMTTETPHEYFWSFGITDDGTPLLGFLYFKINGVNSTKGTTAAIDGINRLPANNSLVLYTDKGPASNYCLDDAYEVVIDCDYDYKVFHGETITGTVTSISAPGTARSAMRENRLILTARGSAISKISSYEIGDEISTTVNISYDAQKHVAEWRTVKTAIGGHVPVIINGVSQNCAEMRNDPMTLMGVTNDDKIILLTNDGRQSGYSDGVNRWQWDELCAELGIKTAFLLDGGGSTTMISEIDDEYQLVNRPSDTFDNGDPGKERAIVNAIILSYQQEQTVCEHEFSPVGTVTVVPTPTTYGVYSYPCTKCDETNDIQIPRLGDVNDNGSIDAADLLSMKIIIFNSVTVPDVYLPCLDIDHSGAVNSTDVFYIKYVILNGIWM